MMSLEGVRIHVCALAQVYANFVQAAFYFSHCLTTDTHTSVSFTIKVYIGLTHPRSRFCCLAQACPEVLLCNSWCRLICIMLFRQICLHSFSPHLLSSFQSTLSCSRSGRIVVFLYLIKHKGTNISTSEVIQLA